MPEPTHPRRDDIDFVDGGFYVDDPHEKYDWMRRNAPVYRDANGLWGLASYEAILGASKDTKRFSSAKGARLDDTSLPMMIDMDDPQHWQRRKLVNRGFTPQRVRDTEAKLRQVCDDIIDEVCERGECDFVRDIAAPLPMIMIGDMLGVAPEDRDDLLRWSDDMVSANGSGDEDRFVAAINAMNEYVAYTSPVIASRRRGESTDDLMGVLVHAEVDGDRLTDDDIIYEALLILIGGDETTRHVISGGMEQLLLHPDQHRALAADPAKLTPAIEEMLRWVTPIKTMGRTVTHDTEFFGQPLAAGQRCVLLYESANRDERKFVDPYRFDIERHPNEHLAFGFGTHFCLGNSLARLELNVMFERLLARLPDLELAADPATLPRRRANFISGLETMPVTFTPSKPVAR